MIEETREDPGCWRGTPRPSPKAGLPRFGVFHWRNTFGGAGPNYHVSEAVHLFRHEKVAQRWADRRNEEQRAARQTETHVVRTLAYCTGFDPAIHDRPPDGKPSLFRQRV